MYQPLLQFTIEELENERDENELLSVRCKDTDVFDNYQNKTITKMIDHVSQLPDWFRLETYDELRKLDDDELFLNLAVRTITMQYLSELSSFSIGLRGFADIINKPVTNREHIFQSDYMEFWYTEHFWISGDQHPIAEMTLSNLRILTSEYNGKLKETETLFNKTKYGTKAQPYETRLKDAREFGWQSLSELHQNNLGHPAPDYMTFYSIDTDYPDDKIVEGILEIVKKRRQDNRIEPYRKKPRWLNPQGWLKQAIIPYFDLYTWATLNQIQIPHRVYVDALFPDGNRGESNLENTTIINFNRVFNHKTINYFLQLIDAQR